MSIPPPPPPTPPPPPPPSLPPPPPNRGSGTGATWKDHSRPPHAPFLPSSRWGLGDAFSSYAIFLLGSILAVLVAFGVQGRDADLGGPWLPLIVITAPTLQLAHVMWVGRARGSGLDPDFGFGFRSIDLAIAGALFIVALVGASVAAVIMAALGAAEPTASVASLAEDAEAGGGIDVWLITLAVLASTAVPVIEELVYRGLWWSALLKRGMSENWVLVVTSAVFAAAHLEPGRILILFALGLGIGWGRKLTGRIWAGIVAHAAINTIGMIALLAEFT